MDDEAGLGRGVLAAERKKRTERKEVLEVLGWVEQTVSTVSKRESAVALRVREDQEGGGRA